MFAVVLGLAGWANAWRMATMVWSVPAVIGEGLHLVALLVWLGLALLFANKWACRRDEAFAEFAHPIQGGFVGLAGISTMLVGDGLMPHSPWGGGLLASLGLGATLAFAAWRSGTLLKGDRDPLATTPVLYLPTVAGAFVAASVLARWGHPLLAEMAFGAGVLSWLAIESVLLHRLFNAPALTPSQRPTLGILLAPPAAGCAAYLAIPGHEADAVARALLGYALLQAMVLLRLLPWIREQPFALGYWAFTFGATALAADVALMAPPAGTSLASLAAPAVFVAVNAAMLWMTLRTIGLLFGHFGLPFARRTT